MPHASRAAEVPSFALFDTSFFSRPAGRFGQSMLKVAPLGKRALKGRFTRTPENGPPLERKASMQEVSPLVRFRLRFQLRRDRPLSRSK